MINGESAFGGKMGMPTMSKSRTTTIERTRPMTRKLLDIHPGEILREEFLKPMGITAYRLAKETRIGQMRISEILRGKRGISADTALRLARFFGNSPVFWTNLQSQFDLEVRESEIASELDEISPIASSIRRA